MNQDWTFPWQDTAEVLDRVDAECGLELEERRRFFFGPAVRVTTPLVLPIDPETADLAQYLRELPKAPTRHFVVLLQAGAVALGVFEAGETLATKSDKKYVVRGRGHAQPTHLASKGKSRYGSRLRLQNARRLLDATSQRLHDWVEEFGPAEQVYYSASVRLWMSLLQHSEPPPFGVDDGLIKIPLDLPVPTTETLLRTYRKMSHGRVEYLGMDD